MNDSGRGAVLPCKLLIFFFSMMSVVALAFLTADAWELSKRRSMLAGDQTLMKKIREILPQVQVLVEAGVSEEKLREERQTGNWTSFFASVAQASGLEGNQYRLPALKRQSGRNYIENVFEIRINPKTGVDRRKIATFLWSVENRRTYLKTREVSLKRSGEADDWGGEVTVAYREKK